MSPPAPLRTEAERLARRAATFEERDALMRLAGDWRGMAEGLREEIAEDASRQVTAQPGR